MEDSLTKFINNWNREAMDCPDAVLDFTWPSISVCELIILPLFGKKQLSNIELEIMRGMVNYCAEFVSQIWHEVGIKATIEIDEINELVLIGVKDSQLNKIRLESVFKIAISERPFPLKIFSNYSRNISTPHGTIAPIILGVVLGLHPEFDGSWADQTEDESKIRIESIVAVLARTVVNYFQRMFPQNNLLYAERLYQSGAIYPPVGMRERFPLVDRVKSFVSELMTQGFTHEQQRKIAESLFSNPDFQIAGIGLVILGALGPPYSNQLFAKAERFGRSAGFLRPAIVELRKELKLNTDWMQVKSEEQIIRLYEAEQKLGIIPFIYPPSFNVKQYMSDSKIADLVKALVSSDISASLSLSMEIIVGDPKLINIRFQRAYLELLVGNIQDANLTLRALLTEPGVEEDWRVYHLLGLVAASMGNFSELSRYFKIAFELCPDDNQYFDNVCVSYARALQSLGEYNLALEVIDRGLKTLDSSLCLLLLKTNVLRAAKREFADSLKQCKILSPLDPRVFSEVFFVN